MNQRLRRQCAILLLSVAALAAVQQASAQQPPPPAGTPESVLQSFQASVADPFQQLSSWASGSACDGTWNGVACSNGDVVALDLRSFGLAGSLPASFSALSSLQQLSLQSNSFNGTLPAAWSALTQLTLLELQSNQVAGTLPSAWSALAGLSRLNLASNALVSTIPSSWGSLAALTRLIISSNTAMCGSVPAGLAGKVTAVGTAIGSACPPPPSPPPPPPSSDYWLLQLKSAVSRDPGGVLNSWSAGTAACSVPWDGVTCVNGAVTSVDLSFQSLEVTGEQTCLHLYAKVFFSALHSHAVCAMLPCAGHTTTRAGVRDIAHIAVFVRQQVRHLT